LNVTQGHQMNGKSYVGYYFNSCIYYTLTTWQCQLSHCFWAVHPLWLSVHFLHRSCYHDVSWTFWAISAKLTGNMH